MPTCKYCGKDFNRDRDTKLFCGSTCRSLFRYHKKDSVQDKPVSVQIKEVTVTKIAEPVIEEDLIYVDGEPNSGAEDWNAKENLQRGY